MKELKTYIVTLFLLVILLINKVHASEKKHYEVVESSIIEQYDPFLLKPKGFPLYSNSSFISFEKEPRQYSLDSLYQLLSELSAAKTKITTKRTVLTCELDPNAVSILGSYLDSLYTSLKVMNASNYYQFEYLKYQLNKYEIERDIRKNKEAKAYLYWSIISILLLIIIIIASLTEAPYIQLASIILFALSFIATLYYLWEVFITSFGNV